MKRSLIFIVFLLALFCNGDGQENDYDVSFTLNSNTDGVAKTEKYLVWFWAGADTNLFDNNILSMDFAGVFDHDSLVVIYGANSTAELIDIYSSPLNGEYLIAAIKARSPEGIESVLTTFSPAFKKADVRAPQNVANAAVRQ